MKDCNVVRLSVSDPHGGEYWMEIPDQFGAAYREAREEAITAIHEAMDIGCPPGEVRIVP